MKMSKLYLCSRTGRSVQVDSDSLEGCEEQIRRLGWRRTRADRWASPVLPDEQELLGPDTLPKGRRKPATAWRTSRFR